jgi:hypothetical protein
MRLIAGLFVVATAMLATVISTAAQAPGGGGASTTSINSTALSATQRATITRDLIARWQADVRKTPGGDVARWSAKLKANIARADAANILRATTMTSLELVHAALGGYVPNDSESQPPRAIGNAAVTPQVLGSTIADTVYTPLPKGRCRIADSRVTNLPLPAGGTRNLYIDSLASYASQGGSGTYANGDGSTNCGIPGNMTAVAVSVTLMSPTANGVFKVYSYGTPSPAGNSILFNAGDFGANGDLIVTYCQVCAFDISVAASGGSVHYVIDVIGYFMRPQATPLDCYETGAAVRYLTAGAMGNAVAPGCGLSYTATVTNCQSESWDMPIIYSRNGTCSARNNGSVMAALKASRLCCRVPGR